MVKASMSPNVIYEFHHALDPVILQVADRVLKLNCFKRAHEHFSWDMLNDIYNTPGFSDHWLR